MTIKELILELSKLPQDALIGKVAFDEDECVHGYSYFQIKKNSEELGIEKGNKTLDYYVE
jgi:hypothetical protein